MSCCDLQNEVSHDIPQTLRAWWVLGGEGGGRTSNYVRKYLRLPQQHVPNRV